MSLRGTGSGEGGCCAVIPIYCVMGARDVKREYNLAEWRL